MDDEFQRNIVFYEHKRLVVAGTTGTMEERLIEVEDQIMKGCWPIEVAPSRIEPDRLFKALFKFNPKTLKPEFDITIDQYDSIHQSNFTNNSIVGYGLDKPRLAEAIEEVAKAVGFVSYPVEKPVKKTWSREFEIEKEGYKMLEELVNLSKIPIEDAFGLVRYTHFLIAYQNMPEVKAQIQAAERFGISSDR
ncbi:MAG: hypothetical protein AABW63_01155 [Nanoarchaeota archaeon]